MKTDFLTAILILSVLFGIVDESYGCSQQHWYPCTPTNPSPSNNAIDQPEDGLQLEWSGDLTEIPSVRCHSWPRRERQRSEGSGLGRFYLDGCRYQCLCRRAGPRVDAGPEEVHQDQTALFQHQEVYQRAPLWLPSLR